ncbi:hypothetical protein C5S35_18315, partial [Candidatus Methanophagaceae archaeon]
NRNGFANHQITQVYTQPFFPKGGLIKELYIF